ncbi:DsbA family protein [Chloroflexota bacterium]
MKNFTTRAVLIASVTMLLLFSSASTGCATSSSTPELTPPATRQTVPSLPSSESSLEIVIYTDFECGACGKLHSEIEPLLREQYVTTGKAQIEIRLVGALSSDSLRAAEAALCAGDQGRFMEYQDALFRAWQEKGAEAFSRAALVRLGGSLGLDEEAMTQCLENHSKRAELAGNMSLLKGDGVTILPAVVVEGAKVQGFKSMDRYVQLIERALANRES